MSLPSGSNTGGYLLRRIPPGADGKAFFRHYVVTGADKEILEMAATQDAYRYVYNGVASFLGGISGLQCQHVAWAITQMYYCAFYIGRATLCRNGQLIFHVPKDRSSGHTQYELKIAVGQQATVAPIPSTHKLVADRFQRAGYPAFMRGLVVDGNDPLLWLMEQREFWQYRSGRFPDPELPGVLAHIEIAKVQRLLSAYEDDKIGVYLSDPAHALISVPFRLVTWALSLDPLQKGDCVTPDDIAHLRKRCIVGKQQLSAISRYFQN